MSSMEHQEVDLSKPQNQDLIWDLDSMARRELQTAGGTLS